MHLTDIVESLPKTTKPQIAALKKLGIQTVQDLLLYFPYRYLNFSKTSQIKNLVPGESVTIRGIIKNISSRFSFHGRLSLAEAIVSDDSGSIKVVWFNQAYLAKTLQKGNEVFLAGTPEYYNLSLQLTNPLYEKVSDFPIHTARLVPVYHLTEKIYPKTFRNLIAAVLPLAEQVEENLPTHVLREQHLPKISQTIRASHFPENDADLTLAQKRLAFEEIFYNQLLAQKHKLELMRKQAYVVKFDQNLVKTFLGRLPFELTAGQKKATWDILQDLEKPVPMNRLLEGDVGSGKTLVALIAALEAMSESLQVVLLAPTEILARQHSLTAFKFLMNPPVNFNTRVSLLTRSYAQKNTKEFDRKKLIKQLGEGMPGLVIGTHALLQEKIKFKDLALVIIDEQHRFGVNQRAQLIRGHTQTETQTNADGPVPLLYQDLTYKIRKCAFKVKKELGLGHKEVVYQNALEMEFQNEGLNYEREKTVPVEYQGKKVGTYQPDFVLEGKIIVELKALNFIGQSEKKQIWSYVKGSQYKLGLLINFGQSDITFERIIFEKARSNPRESASSPRESASDKVPHLLSLSATPIPRTLQLAYYGELDISQIKSKPANRKPILTKLVAKADRAKAYQFIDTQIKAGRQAFVITPLIEESDKLGVKAAKTEVENLKKVFPKLEIGLMHGRLKGAEKEAVMSDFLAKKIDILVSTSVVEVGVDVPNASVMAIEASERFGLAQLHQFRGRVGRAEHQSYCFLFTENENPDILQRLTEFTKTNDGFELAELDLKQRGFGELYGGKQSGWNFKYFNPNYVALIPPAREQALKILREDLNLQNYPKLKEKIKDQIIHFE